MVFSDYYLPGYKSGGGMRTIVNMVDRLHRTFDFLIVTRDHDGRFDKKPYETVKINDWNEIRNAKVFYLSKNNIKLSKLRQLIWEVRPDSIYFNSYFATLAIYVLTLRKLALIPETEIILAPCGELSKGALQIKSKKKKTFMAYSKISGLYNNIIWKASSELEKEEIEKVKGENGRIFIAPDLPPRVMFENFQLELKPPKKPGEAKMVFLSRFVRKKNFKWLLENLQKIEGRLEVDIWGPLEENGYWRECLKIIEKLPSNIQITARGSVSHEKVYETLVKYHFFILPTLGENFGHVFLEALASGCPLIISDRTPWLGLEEKGLGWDLALEKPEKWVKTINYCINLDSVNYSKLVAQGRDFLSKWLLDPKIEEDTLTILKKALGNGSGEDG